MKKIFVLITIILLFVVPACKKDSEFLDIPPKQIIPEEVAFSDPALVLSILGDLYNRQLDFSSLDGAGWRSFADFSESFPSENGSYSIVKNTGWGYGTWGIDWFGSYGYIRDLNLFIARDSAATKLSAPDKLRFLAEGRFLRANYYFEMVKRMGGVPLILKPLTYDLKGDPTYLQTPRSKEAEIYDFVISEMEGIKNDLPSGGDKSRATKAAALAVESRAALYAGSIAKYGATTPQVTLPGGEVGIAANKANDYFTIALKSAEEIIKGTAGVFKLYKVLPNLSDNFAAIFLDKSTVNQETIWLKDFKAGSGGGKVHNFTVNDQPFSNSDEGDDAGRLNPSLNLIEQFEKLDNTFGPLPTTDVSGNPLYYSNVQDIFAGRDARLSGTALLPGDFFKSGQVDIWAGYVLANGSVFTSDNAVNLKTLPGGSAPVQVVGKDGPISGLQLRTQSGFYIRKYLDPTTGSGRRGRGSDVAFLRYRYAEVLLNAAEAAFELGDIMKAANYINQVRSRAGLIIPLVAGDITFDRIVHERRVELAFEGHILYDYKRWRIASKVWDGVQTSLTDLKTNIGKSSQRSTQPWGLWPFKYYNLGNPNDGKWLFREVLPGPVNGSNLFQLGNYYSFIGDDVRAANPKIVKQPNQ